MEIIFRGYKFRFWLVTTLNRYEPAAVQRIETPYSLLARSELYSFGEGTGSMPGKFEVVFEERAGEITWQVSASHAEPIKGVRVAISPLPGGTVVLPFAEVDLKPGDPGRCFIYPGGYYPVRHVSSTHTQPFAGPVHDWAAPFVVFNPDENPLVLSAPEYPPRVKKMWLYRTEAGHLVYLYSEANASQRATTYTSPLWRITPTPDWRLFATAHADWMGRAYGIQPFPQRAGVQPWVKQLGLVVIMHGLGFDGKVYHSFAEMAARLPDLAKRFPPERTLIKLSGFEGPIDRCWPDAVPSPVLGGVEAFRRLVGEGRQMGFHFIPHLNVWGSSFENPRTAPLLVHQIHDSEGRPCSWTYDHDQDEIAEEIMAYISPAAPQWRKIILENVGKLVEWGVDAIYLDQTGTFFNDLRHDHYAGLRDLYAELRAAYPHIQFAGEAPNSEVTTSLVSMVCGISTLSTRRLSELYLLLFGPYIRQYGYNHPPEPYRGIWNAVPPVALDWSREGFLNYEERSSRVGGIPSLNLTDRRISLDGDLVSVVFERARKYSIL